MSTHAAFHRRCILTLVAFVWFFSFIICVSQRIIYIDILFTIIHKILIHHHHIGNVVTCVLLENKNVRFEGRRKVRVIAEADKVNLAPNPVHRWRCLAGKLRIPCDRFDLIWWVYRLVENVPSPLWPNYMTNLCICIYRWWILHGGNVTVSYSHPLWHIPTRWQYDWWELAGRMMMMMRASMRRQIFAKKHTLAKLLWTSGVTCCFAKQQHSNVFHLLSLCLNENFALAVSVREAIL